MIKSNTNMEETGELVSPRPPKSVCVARVNTNSLIEFMLDLWRPVKADLITRRIDEKWKKEKPKAIIALMDKWKNVKETLETVHAKSSSETFVDMYTSEESLEDIARLILFDIDKQIEEIKEEKIKQLFVFLFAFILFLGKASNPGYQASPERGKISCINVYLLGNDGTHAYNGNGILFSRQRRSTKYKHLDEEDIDLNREPTNEEITLIAQEMAGENIKIAYVLGLDRIKIQQILLDNPTTELRSMEILFHWRDVVHRDGGATIKMLANAFTKAKINPKKVLAKIR